MTAAAVAAARFSPASLAASAWIVSSRFSVAYCVVNRVFAFACNDFAFSPEYLRRLAAQSQSHMSIPLSHLIARVLPILNVKSAHFRSPRELH